jgi:hypothetical protein
VRFIDSRQFTDLGTYAFHVGFQVTRIEVSVNHRSFRDDIVSQILDDTTEVSLLTLTNDFEDPSELPVAEKDPC